MRDLKFRAWHKLEKVMGEVGVMTMGEGCFVHGVEKGHDTHPTEVETGKLVTDTVIVAPDEGCFCRFEMLEVMQYTGLKDKNDVEIYEGDIVKYFFSGAWYTDVVIFKRGTFVLQKRWKSQSGTDLQIDMFHLGYAVDGEMAGNAEVLGNVYENKELLDDAQ